MGHKKSCTSVKGKCGLAVVFLKKKNTEHTTMDLIKYNLFRCFYILYCSCTFVFKLKEHSGVFCSFWHTSWYLSQRTRLGGSFHSGASHRDTGSQSLEDDRNDCFCKAGSHLFHVPLQSLVGLHKTQVIKSSEKTNLFLITFFLYPCQKGCIRKT